MSHNKRFFLLALFLCLASITLAQKKLTIKKMQIQYWNDYKSEWTGWSGYWTEFDEGSEPVMKISNFGDGDFLFEMWVDGEYSSFTLDFSHYDSRNEWYVYEDVAGDEVCVSGSTLSYLSSNGWPSNLVKIYFWLYSEDMAMVMI